MILLDEVGVGLERGPGFRKVKLEDIVGLSLVRNHENAIQIGTVGKNLAGLVKFIHIAVKELRHKAFPDLRVRNQGLIERVMLEAGI